MANEIPAGRVIQGARQMLGAKWRHEGRTRFGVDCIGLVLLSLSLAGWRPRDARSAYRMVYPRVADADTLQSILATEGTAVELAEAQPGDVIVFHYPSARFAQHCGILTVVASASVPVFAGAEAGATVLPHTGTTALADRRAWIIHACTGAKRVVEVPMGDSAVSAFRIAGVIQVPAGTPMLPFSPAEFLAAETLILEGSKLWARHLEPLAA